MKVCTICGANKALDEFDKRPLAKIGYHSACKVCSAIARKERYAKNKARINAVARAKYAANPLQYEPKRAALRQANPERCAAYSQKWRAANPDQVRESHKKIYWSNVEKMSLKAKKYRATNPEKMLAYRIKNAEANKINSANWRVNNRDRANAKRAARRAAKLQATPRWYEKSAVEWLYLDSQTNPAPHHIDHILPLKNKKVCGLHCLANLQILSVFDNLSKGNCFDQDSESIKQLEITRSLTINI